MHDCASEINIIALIPLFLQLFALVPVVLIDPYIGKRQRRLIDLTDGTHIGIRNVRERIERMCGGTLTVESEIGKGTTVTIRIPC